jgi:hypothetical protein
MPCARTLAGMEALVALLKAQAVAGRAYDAFSVATA